MNILHLSTFGRLGGAAIAARRLHEGLRQLGHDSTMLCRDGGLPGDLAAEQAASLTSQAVETALYPIYRRFRTAGVDTLFSIDLPTRRFSDVAEIQRADVVHLHWVAGLASAAAIRGIQALGKPIVWTLHDQAPFTGGCHYSGDCVGYRVACDACPQLEPAAAHVPSAFLADKRAWLSPPAMDIVCPSEWLAACARSSALLHGATVRTIPNGLPVRVYQGVAQDAARLALGLPSNALVILIGSDRLDERRKGHAHAVEAMARLAASPAFGDRLRRGEIVCAAFGDGALEQAGIPVVRLGRLEGDGQLALAYRAADLFLLPSIEDNLPNTLLEATAAGIPVVAYATGGIPDVVERAGCGLLAPRGDVAALGAALTFIADDPAARRRMGMNGETYAATHLDLPVQAAAYLAVYGEQLEQRAAATRAAVSVALERGPGFATAVVEAEARLVDTVLANGELNRRLTRLLAADHATQQTLIASRGGEIDYLRREIARIEDGWRVSRETLHQVEQDLSGVSRTLQATETARATASAERAALARKLRLKMIDVVVLATGDTGRRLWEALTRSGAAHVVCFLDPGPRQVPRSLLGLGVHGTSWLDDGSWDVIVAPDEPADVSLDLVAAGVDPARIIVVPIGVSDEALAADVAVRFPDALAPWLGAAARPDAVRIGVFGTGSAAMKVWEALTELDDTETVWFADNNPARQGSSYLWVDVIAPADILSRGCDAVVIGSMSRDPIRQQLTALGVDPSKVIAPDVSSTPERIRRELAEWLQRRQTQEVAR